MSSSDDIQQQHPQPHQCILLPNVSAYTRPGEEKTNPIIRNSNTLPVCCKVFGVKGRDNLFNLYYGSLAILKANRTKFMEKLPMCKYILLSNLLDSLGKEDILEMEKLNVKAANEQLRVTHLRLVPVTDLDRSRVDLYLYDLTGVYVTGIHLFVDQLVKLLKWMNQNQNIGVTNLVTYDTSNDDFIDFMSD